MIMMDENPIDSESERMRPEGQLDPETGLPMTGIDVETGLPIMLPEGVDLTDPVTGKPNTMIDPKTKRLDPETSPVIDPNSGMPIQSSLRVDGRSLNSPRGIPTETAMRVNQLENFVQQHEGPQQFGQTHNTPAIHNQSAGYAQPQTWGPQQMMQSNAMPTMHQTPLQVAGGRPTTGKCKAQCSLTMDLDL